MAKKKTKNVETKDLSEPVPDDEILDDDDQDDDDDDEGEELELLQVDIGDMLKVKQILDETVAGTILEFLEEDYYYDNIKLAIMTLACAFAMIAQFAPINFPESRYVLGACCCLYFILSGILQLITTFIDQDAILLTKPLSTENKKQHAKDDTKKKPKTTSNKSIKNKDLLKYGVRVRTQMPRFSEYYTVVLEFQNVEDTPTVEQEWSVGQFFDKDGMFDEIGIQNEIEKLYKRFEDAKFDTKPKSDKKKD